MSLERHHPSFRTQQNQLREVEQNDQLRGSALVSTSRHRHIIIIPDYTDNTGKQLISFICNDRLTRRRINLSLGPWLIKRINIHVSLILEH